MTTKPTHKITRRASDVLFDEVSGSRNSLRRENIRLIKEVCDWMEKDKVHISVAEVVRRCGTDGPAYSTVANQGSHLGEYIRLRVAEQAATPRSASSTQSIADTVRSLLESGKRFVFGHGGVLRGLDGSRGSDAGATIPRSPSRIARPGPSMRARPNGRGRGGAQRGAVAGDCGAPK